MTLKLYNTRTRQKEIFEPIDAQAVRMYVCGPTVYDFAQIGNARPVIVFDVLFRLLRHLYGADHVIYARNITDVDDKINARAAEEGVSIRELTARTAAQFHADAAALGCLPPTVEPRATDHIKEMISLIERLIARGHAYAAEGHVLFDVASDPDYGLLARRSLDEMRAGARVEVAPYKRDPMDFVLWKPSTGSEPGWESPWGFGRPGWHLECSAMAEKHLGEVFDIHGGGIDLLFPHHENEVAQSTCAHGTEIMANIWMHNGHLQVEGAKMSKSLGNFVTIHDLLTSRNFGGPWLGSVLRHAMLKTHYAKPMDWTVASLAESRQEMAQWCRFLWEHGAYRLAVEGFYLYEVRDHFSLGNEIVEALSDDLNTPEALTTLREQFRKAKSGGQEDKADFLSNLDCLGLVTPENIGALAGMSMGLINLEEENRQLARDYQILQANGAMTAANDIFKLFRSEGVTIESDPDGTIRIEAGDGGASHIEDMIKARLAARKAKNWAEADRIRNDLAAMGITLKDAKNPATGEIETTWEVAR